MASSARIAAGIEAGDVVIAGSVMRRSVEVVTGKVVDEGQDVVLEGDEHGDAVDEGDRGQHDLCGCEGSFASERSLLNDESAGQSIVSDNSFMDNVPANNVTSFSTVAATDVGDSFASDEDWVKRVQAESLEDPSFYELPGPRPGTIDLSTLDGLPSVRVEHSNGSEFTVYLKENPLLTKSNEAPSTKVMAETVASDEPLADLSTLRTVLPAELWLRILGFQLKGDRPIRPRPLPMSHIETINAMSDDPNPMIRTTYQFFDVNDSLNLARLPRENTTYTTDAAGVQITEYDPIAKLLLLQKVNREFRYDAISAFYRVNTFQFGWAHWEMLQFLDALSLPSRIATAPDRPTDEHLKLCNLRHLTFWLPCADPFAPDPDDEEAGPLDELDYVDFLPIQHALALLVRAHVGPDICIGAITPCARLVLGVTTDAHAAALDWLARELLDANIALSLRVRPVPAALPGFSLRARKYYIQADWRFADQPSATSPPAFAKPVRDHAARADTRWSIPPGTCPPACRRQHTGRISAPCGRASGRSPRVLAAESRRRGIWDIVAEVPRAPPLPAHLDVHAIRSAQRAQVDAADAHTREGRARRVADGALGHFALAGLANMRLRVPVDVPVPVPVDEDVDEDEDEDEDERGVAAAVRPNGSCRLPLLPLLQHARALPSLAIALPLPTLADPVDGATVEARFPVRRTLEDLYAAWGAEPMTMHDESAARAEIDARMAAIVDEFGLGLMRDPELGEGEGE